MPEDFESAIAQALIDQGGPPEIAPQLVAIAAERELSHCLKRWIDFHIGTEWSARQFDEWCVKFNETMKRLKAQGAIILEKENP